MKRRERHRPRIDLLLLVAALAAGILVFARFRALRNSPLVSEGVRARVTVTVESVTEAQAMRLAEAETVTLSDGTYLGTLESPFLVSPAMVESVREDGSLAYTESLKRKTLTGTLICTGSHANGSFFLDGNRRLSANQRYSVEIHGLKVTILILNVSVF